MSTTSDPRGAERPRSTTFTGAVRRLRHDLRQGRNLDLYLIVAVALGVTLAGVLGAADSQVLAAATLGVLAVMAISGLVSRHAVDEVRVALHQIAANEAGEVAADRFLSLRRAGLDAEITGANEIALVGVTLTRTVRDMLPLLDRRLRAGARLRVVLIDTDSDANLEAVARSKKADMPGFYRRRVSSTLDLLRVLASSGPSESALQIRVLPYVPTFGLCMLDAEDTHGRMWVEMYQHRTVEPNPTFKLRADRDGQWYALFRGQFETMWESARELDPRQNAEAASNGTA
ncbi:hypothetical protein AAH979_17625 [Plantactinospora sp. ZYX-F-223]|uniref:hypothetical protein n=1 Tax=Plantactinospora sp. ZYX-F-223 TaxID=3144103 RepID=UPI0031FC475E